MTGIRRWAGKTISVFYTAQFFLLPLREVLNLGIMHADIGSVHWEGNHFQTRCEVNHMTVRISGDLVARADGRADSLRVRYDFPAATHSYVVHYGYQPPLKYAFLPSVMTNFWVPKARSKVSDEIELNQWRILEIEIAGGPLAAEHFDVAPFAQWNDWPIRVYTNGGFYQPSTNGTLRLIAMLGAQNQNRRPPGRAELGAFYAGWGAMNLVIFALLVGAKRSEKSKPNEKGPMNHEIQI